MGDETKNNEKICSVKHIRRVDLIKESRETDDGEYQYSYTEEKTALDIVEQDGQFYVVLTESHYCHSYDQYESPMNTYSESTSFKIYEIGENMKEADKAALLAYMDNAERIRGSYDYAGYPETGFVCAQVERALKKHADELRIAEKKKNGECGPNAIYITSIGRIFGIYIDDFSSNEVLARTLCCDAVTVCRKDSEPEIGYFENAKRRSGIIYNRLASAFLNASLDGDVVICAMDKDGKPTPFSDDELSEIFNRLVIMQKYRNI